MLTGDAKKVAEQVASSLNIDWVFSELLPADKVSKVEEQEQDMDTGGVPQQLEKFCQNIQLPLLQVFVCAVNLFLRQGNPSFLTVS